MNYFFEQLKLYKSYELPKPLEAYKVPSLKPKSKANINNADVDFSKKYGCHICSSRFTSNQNLQSHVIKFHSEHYNCGFCKRAFALDQVEDLKRHMFKHEHKMPPSSFDQNSKTNSTSQFSINEKCKLHIDNKLDSDITLDQSIEINGTEYKLIHLSKLKFEY